MNLQLSPKTEALIRQRLDSGQYATEDQLLQEALEALDSADSDWAAIQEGLAALDDPSSWIPLEVAFEDIRTRHQIPKDA